MKKILDKLNIENVNSVLYFLKNILKILYFLIILLAIYSFILICKEWSIFKFILKILKLLSPLFIGVVIAYLLNPIVEKMNKKINRKLAVAIIYIFLILILYFIWSYIYPKFKGQLNDLMVSLPNIIDSANVFLNNLFNKFPINKSFTIDIKDVAVNYLDDFTIEKASNLIVTLKNAISILGVILLGLIISFYILLDFDKLKLNIKNMIPLKSKNKILELLREIDSKVFSYVKGTSLIAFIVFITSSILFEFVKLKGSIFFGLYNAITNIIPYIGPYIGAIPIVLVAFTSSKKVGIGTLIIIIFIQVVESYILQPIVMSKSMKLHPVTILVSLLLFGYFFGIIGMVLAMPIISIVKTVITFIYQEKTIISKE